VLWEAVISPVSVIGVVLVIAGTTVGTNMSPVVPVVAVITVTTDVVVKGIVGVRAVVCSLVGVAADCCWPGEGRAGRLQAANSPVSRSNPAIIDKIFT